MHYEMFSCIRKIKGPVFQCEVNDDKGLFERAAVLGRVYEGWNVLKIKERFVIHTLMVS